MTKDVNVLQFNQKQNILDIKPQTAQNIELTHAIHLKKRVAKDPLLVFVAVKESGKRAVFDREAAMIHVVGYWKDEPEKLREMWFPYETIQYIESLLYRK